MKTRNIIDWSLAIISAAILIQTLRFKLTGAEESIYIFSTLGLEPQGRIGTAIVELIAGVLLIIPQTRAWGALISLGTISGALFFHLTSLGIEVQGDHGLLFVLALIVFICSTVLVFMHRKQLPFLKKL